MRLLNISRVNTFLIGIVLLVILLCSGNQVQAAQDGDYTYTVIDDKAQITKYTGAGGDVTIPSALGGVPVTSIGDYAFASCISLTSISIPQGVTSIEEKAFLGCKGLKSVSISQGVTSIGPYVFYGCTGLTSIKVAVDNLNYASIDDVLYNKAGTVLIVCPGGLKTVSIPGGVTSIVGGAFAWCASLTSISIPEGVTSIGDRAFSGCAGLINISIPGGVTSIGDFVFSYCNLLTNVSIPESVTSVGADAFLFCESLTSISIPEGVTSIGNGAFYGCKSLTSISIPEGVTSIGNGAFYGCESLTSISIPGGVTSIGNRAFVFCTRLTSITVAVDNLNYSSIYGALYNKAGTVLISCPGGLTNISIPQGVTSIGDSALEGCTGLTSLNIPQGVTSIGGWAFSECRGLTSINIPQGVTSIGNGGFFGCTGLTSISIPQGITNIGMHTFNGCTGLTNISIPEGVTSIEDMAFASCTGLTTFSIPQGVTSIGFGTFNNCISLTTIIFNSAKTTIYDNEYTIPAATKIIGYDRSTAKTYATKYSRTFEVLDTAMVSSVSMKLSLMLTAGQAEQLIATITPENAFDKSVTWSVYNQGSINIASVSTTGLVTAMNPGTAVIRAISNADPTKYAECSVTVTAPLANLSATPLVKIGINPNYGDSAGIFIGLKDIRDTQGKLVPDAKLAGYQIEVNYDHNQAQVLDVYDEAHLGEFFIFNNEPSFNRTNVVAVVYPETSNFEKLFFIPLALTGNSNPTNVSIKFTSIVDTNLKLISIPDVTLTFQRGKILNETSQSLSIADAVAGLQYLAKLVDAGLNTGEVNVINMASILPPEVGSTVIKPNVKDIIALMQKLVGLRDDSFAGGGGGLPPDYVAANAVTNQITALPVTANLTLNDATAVGNAKRAFDVLTTAQKALVSAAYQTKLSDAVDKIVELQVQAAVDQAAADNVIAQITAIPTTTALTLSDASTVGTTKTSFDALTSGQKALVTNLTKLTEAVAKIAELQVQPPSAPSGINATAVSGTVIFVHWNLSDTATGYRVYRDGNPVTIADVTGSGFNDTGLDYGHAYSYTVVAYNGMGDSVSSDSVSATTFSLGPLIVNGVVNGSIINHDVTITAQSEGHTVTISETGSPDAVANNVVYRTISTEGVHTLTITATGGTQPVTLIFTIDKTAPNVSISGVTENASMTNTPAGVNLSVACEGVANVDYRPDTQRVLLNGNAYDITQPLTQPGQYTVSASVRDAAGNIGTSTVHFTIVWDTVAPTITIGEISDGSTYASATPSITLTGGSNLVRYTYSATITRPDGTRVVYQQGDSIPELSTEGKYTITVDALNPSYVEFTSRQTARFWIDRTAPTGAILQVQDQVIQNKSVTPLINFGDNLASQALLKTNSQVTLTKNGVSLPYSIGNTISDNGVYILTVSTVDGATLSTGLISKTFTIDRNSPAITVTGVTDGTNGATNSSDVTMSVGMSEAGQLIVQDGNGITIDPTSTINATNKQYAFSGVDLAVTNYTVEIIATDLAGNASRKQISFTIDKQPVSIVINGVTENQFLNSLPSITFSAWTIGQNPTLIETTATLDDVSFVSGSSPTTDGTHRLTITTLYQEVPISKTINFTIDRTTPVVNAISVSKNGTVLDATSSLYVKAGDIINVEATITDNILLQNQGQSFSIDSLTGSISGKIPMTVFNGQFSGTWIVGGENLDNLLLNVFGLDVAGNSTEVPWSQRVYIDNMSPEVTLTTSPVAPDGENGYFKAANMNVKLQTAVGGIITGTFNGDNLPAVNNTGTITISAQQGHNKLTYQVQDQAGNLSEPMTYDFDYDSTAPASPSVNSPAPNSTVRTSTINIVGTISEEIGQFGSSVVVRKDDVILAEGTVAQDGTFSVNGVQLSVGLNALTLVTVDYAGNESIPTPYQLTLDTTAPDLAVTKVSETRYRVSVNESIHNLTAKFNGVDIPALNIDGSDVSGMVYYITTAQPIAGANALLISALDAAGNIGYGSYSVSYISSNVNQTNLGVSENAMMDIQANSFNQDSQMTVLTVTSGTFSGDTTYKLLGSSLNFNFSTKPINAVILKVFVGTGLKGPTLFHIDDDGTVGAPIVTKLITSADPDLASIDTMTEDAGYYLADTGYIWLKTKNFSGYQPANDDTPPVISFTVTTPKITIN